MGAFRVFKNLSKESKIFDCFNNLDIFMKNFYVFIFFYNMYIYYIRGFKKNYGFIKPCFKYIWVVLAPPLWY